MPPQVYTVLEASLDVSSWSQDALETLFSESLMQTHDLSWDTLVAMHAQLFSHKIKHTPKSEVKKMVDKCAKPRVTGLAERPSVAPMLRFDGSSISNLVQSRGQMRSIPPGLPFNSIFNVASEFGYSPYLLGRALLQHSLPGKTDKTTVKKLLKEPWRITNEFLKSELEDACEVDRNYSPNMDLIRLHVGSEYEYKLQRHLEILGVAFEAEHELRRKGHAKTPDVKLCVPLGLKDAAGNVRLVHWIDSKAMYGDDHPRNENKEQLMSYVNRYGPGMVIYWFGFDERLEFDNVTVADAFPTTGLVFLGE